MFQDIRTVTTLFNDITPTVSKYWEGPGILLSPLCLHWRGPVSLRLPPNMNFFAVEMSTYTRSEIESYSCVADDVACNAAPAVPSPADAWSGTINNA